MHLDGRTRYADLVAAAHKVIDEWDAPDWQISRLRDLIIDLSEPSIEFLGSRHNRGPVQHRDRGVGQLGGFPRMPKDAPWPKIGEFHLPFIAQLDLARFPRLPNDPLPTHGVLYFFCWCTNERSDHPCEVLWLDVDPEFLNERQLVEQLILPDWRGQRIYDEEIATETTCTLTVSKRALEQAALNTGHLTPGDVRDDFFGDFPAEYRHDVAQTIKSEIVGTWGRSLGYACQDLLHPFNPVRGGYFDGKQLWVNLLQVDSINNMEWSDLGYLEFLIPADDLSKRRFRNVQAEVMSS